MPAPLSGDLKIAEENMQDTLGLLFLLVAFTLCFAGKKPAAVAIFFVLLALAMFAM
jgi:hypothetical protein